MDILQRHFVCDLNKCKGACCVKGDAGAPLLNEELLIIDRIYEKVKPYMRMEGIKAIEANGRDIKMGEKWSKDGVKWTVDEEGENVTPLVNGKECAYVVFEKNGSTRCSFELAYKDGKTGFKKPLSCHLYPVRIQKLNLGSGKESEKNVEELYEGLNFHEWEICSPACECGEKLQVPVYKFLKEALIRKYGEEWYKELEIADRMIGKKTI